MCKNLSQNKKFRLRKHIIFEAHVIPVNKNHSFCIGVCVYKSFTQISWTGKLKNEKTVVPNPFSSPGSEVNKSDTCTSKDDAGGAQVHYLKFGLVQMELGPGMFWVGTGGG